MWGSDLTDFTRHSLPAEIAVFMGCFQSQILVFAHLQDVAGSLDLDHVEVIKLDNPRPRLHAYFDEETADAICDRATQMDTIILVLPAAFQGLKCPIKGDERLHALGAWRGTVTRLVAHPKE